MPEDLIPRLLLKAISDEAISATEIYDRIECQFARNTIVKYLNVMITRDQITRKKLAHVWTYRRKHP